MKTILRERSMDALADKHRQSAVESKVTLINIMTAALDHELGVGAEFATEHQAKKAKDALLMFRRHFPGTPYQDFNIVIPPHEPTWVWLIPTKLDGGKREEEQVDGSA